MKHFLYIFILFFVLQTQTQAQKTTNKSFPSDGISSIIIEGSSVFKISVETTKEKTISIQSHVEGENNEQVVLIAEIKNNQLFVSSAYQPLYVADDDKLSANKLISIEFKLLIPEQLDVLITSNLASVFIYGNYNQVTTELINGSFNAENFQGNLIVNTIHGDINLETNLAKVEVSSKHGTVSHEIITQGNKQIVLNSINGNITVTKTE
jgi:hypothetical protein